MAFDCRLSVKFDPQAKKFAVMGVRCIRLVPLALDNRVSLQHVAFGVSNRSCPRGTGFASVSDWQLMLSRCTLTTCTLVSSVAIWHFPSYFQWSWCPILCHLLQTRCILR